jgi:hypothetical protein
MSRDGKSGMKSEAWRMFALWTLGAGIAIPSYGQYVGRVDTSKDAKTPPLRATAVLEYTGDVTKPVASRLVPIAVWDGSTYQPGGLYMAQPVPLTVESGTQYELEVAGMPKGLFDVKAAANVSGSWIAIGAFQRPAAPKPSHLKASKTIPQWVRDQDDDKPHFAHRPTSSGTGPASSSGSGSGSNSGSASSSNAPPVDPDRPTLHRRTDSDSGSSSSGTSGSNGSSSGSSSTTTTASNPAPAADPDRPTLHKHTAASNANDNGAPVSAIMDVDPDRPRLRRGRPENLESLDVPSDVEIAKLAGNPENLEQMIAVSDAKTREPHNFVYSWTNPDDEKKAQTALEDMAKNLLAGKPLKPAISAQPAKKTTTAATRPPVHRTAKKPAGPPLPDLADEQFKAYELTFGGGATLVFSAKSTMPDGKVKYVTMIAQPDFNGDPQVIFKQVTSDDALDVIPRMQLVDAVDTNADNRGKLIFELAGKTDRQYAIYTVADHAVEQVFSTAGPS